MGKLSNLKGILPYRPMDPNAPAHAPGGQLSEQEIEALNQTSDAIRWELLNDMFTVPPTSMAVTIDRFARIRELKRLLEIAEKAINGAQLSLAKDIKDKMEEWGLPSISTDNYTAYTAQAVYPTVEDHDKLNNWLDKTGLGAYRRIHPGSLKSIVMDHLENGKGPVPGVKVFFEEKARVRKRK